MTMNDKEQITQAIQDEMENEVQNEKENLFSDSFLSYPSELDFSTIVVEKEETENDSVKEGFTFTVINQADFLYSVQLIELPQWCRVAQESNSLNPGEDVTFSLDILCSKLPPGKTISYCKLLIKKPFIRRAYPVKLIVEATHKYPVPKVNITIVSHADRKLSLSVYNAGTGFLQGFCYNQVNRDIQKFSLLGARSDMDLSEDNDSEKSDEIEKLVVEQSFMGSIGERQGIIIMSDCPNKKFRRIEISPDHYFSNNFFNRSVLHFSIDNSGSSNEIELVGRHAYFRRKCKVDIPEKLKKIITVVKNKPGEILFRCKVKQKDSVDSPIIGSVIIDGDKGIGYTMPVAVSVNPKN